MIRVGIIGYGLSARIFHIPFITTADQFELIAISTSQQDAVREALPDVRVFASVEDLLVNAELDLVVITAPNQLHFEFAKLALLQGMHVLLEKPMVTCVDEANELVALASKQSRLLSVYQNRRWDGDFLTVRKLLQQKMLGEVRYFESHFDRYRPDVQQRWREQPGPASGLWWDLGPHLVDQALQLFAAPQAITARLLATRDAAETTDYFHVQLHYPQTEVVLHAGSYSATPNRRFQIEGTQGSFTKFGLDPQEDQLRAGLMPTDAGFGIEQRDNFGTLYNESGRSRVETEAGCYQHYYAAIAAAIGDVDAGPVSSEDALDVIRILELAETSQARGRTIAFAPH